jgi:DHA2 family multidrug resistance protein-like MFS transporter
LFKSPAFSATLAVLFFGLFCWSGVYLFVTQYLQLVLSFSPMKAGLITLLPAALTMVGCMLAPQTLRWLKRSVIIVIGNMIMLTGMLIFMQLDATPQIMLLIIACSCLGLGCGLVVTLGIDLIVSVAPPEQAGAVSGISETSTTLGTAFGVALLGSVGTAVYNSMMSGKIALASKEALSTLGGAFAESQRLPVEAGTELLNQARSAFISAFHLATGISAGLILIIVIIFSIALKRKTHNIQRVN